MAEAERDTAQWRRLADSPLAPSVQGHTAPTAGLTDDAASVSPGVDQEDGSVVNVPLLETDNGQPERPEGEVTSDGSVVNVPLLETDNGQSERPEGEVTSDGSVVNVPLLETDNGQSERPEGEVTSDDSVVNVPLLETDNGQPDRPGGEVTSDDTVVNVPLLETDNGQSERPEEEAEEEEEDDGIPYDRGWAWMVVFGAFLNYTLLGGYLKSSGLFFVALLQKFNAPATHTALLFAVRSAIYSVAGMYVMNVLFYRCGARKLIMTGGLLVAISAILSSLANQLALLITAYSVFIALGWCMLVTPADVVVGRYFRRRRSLALALVRCGAGVGSMTVPPLVTSLLRHYGLNGALLMLGGVLLHTLPASLLIRPTSYFTKRRHRLRHPGKGREESGVGEMSAGCETKAMGRDGDSRSSHAGQNSGSKYQDQNDSRKGQGRNVDRKGQRPDGCMAASSAETPLTCQHWTAADGASPASDVTPTHTKTSGDLADEECPITSGETTRVSRSPPHHASSPSLPPSPHSPSLPPPSYMSPPLQLDSGRTGVAHHRLSSPLQLHSVDAVFVSPQLSHYYTQPQTGHTNTAVLARSSPELATLAADTSFRQRAASENSPTMHREKRAKGPARPSKAKSVDHPTAVRVMSTSIHDLCPSSAILLTDLRVKGRGCPVESVGADGRKEGRTGDSERAGPGWWGSCGRVGNVEEDGREKERIRDSERAGPGLRCSCRRVLTAVVCWPKTLLLTLDLRLLRTPTCLLLLVYSAFMPFIPMVQDYLPAVTTDRGLTKSQAALLLSIIGGLDLACRLCSGFIADLKIARVSNMIVIADVILVVVMQCVRWMTSFDHFVVLAVLQGALHGVAISLYPTLVIDLVGLDNMGRALGFCQLLAGVSMTATYPLLGYIRDTTGSYDVVYHVIGIGGLLAAVLLCCEGPVKRLEARMSRDHTARAT